MTKYYALHPARFKLDGGAMYGIIPKPLWEKKSPPDKLNRIDLALRLIFIQKEKRNILIDTGIGDYHDDNFKQRFGVEGEASPLKNILKKHFDLNPEDITDLILTHLHFDHVGGIKEGEKLTFPNATVYLNKNHYIYALAPTKRDQGSFLTKYFKPVIEEYDQKKQLVWLEENEGTLFNFKDGTSIKYLSSFGHTPFMIHPYDENFIYMADLVPTSNHIKIPWVMGYDIAPGQTTKDKEEILPFIQKENLTMIFEHDPKTLGAKLEQNQKNQWVPCREVNSFQHIVEEINF